MKVNRFKQFFLAFTDKVSEDDKSFVHKYLDEKERELFYLLSVQDQKHSIRVARDVIKECSIKDDNFQTIVKAALLHDIGKITQSLNVIDKSILVILNKMSNGRLKTLDNLPKVNIYYNHPQLGYELMEQYSSDELLLYLIKNHHNNMIDWSKSKELSMLRKCDDRN